MDNECWRCHIKFSDERGLKSHEKNCRLCMGVIYVCKRCYEPFGMLSDLEVHQNRRRKQCERANEIDKLDVSKVVALRGDMKEINKKEKDNLLIFDERMKKMDVENREELDREMLIWMETLSEDGWYLLKKWMLGYGKGYLVMGSMNRVCRRGRNGKMRERCLDGKRFLDRCGYISIEL